MQQIWIPRTGAPDVLDLRDAPDPTPGPGEVLVEVEATGVNFADILARQGIYPDAPPLPTVVGYEVAGRVASVGEGARLGVGADVVALTRFGGYASHVVVPEVAVFERPENVSAEDGAAIPVNYLTAYQMMVVMGSVRHARELGGRRVRVLVHGASGGVGTACGDLGKVYGAELFGTASPGKHGYVRERGYHHAIDYRNDDFVAEVMDLTGGQGVDLVLDAVGGTHWSRSLDALAPSGRLVVYGVSAATGKGKLGLAKLTASVPWVRTSPFALMNANLGVLGVNLGHLWDVRDRVAGWARVLMGYAAKGQIRPHVDRVFGFDQAAQAHQYIEDRKNRGKVLLRP